ncbi:MAG: M23 family metallopeptidase, partial [Bacilli bacterium]|nr:M23 family metallopeptidase [Bacilli bacterium]
GEESYNNFINDTQPEIKETGKKIEKMYFGEKITIKENNISVKEKIYTDATELSQFLLFGKDMSEEKYTIKSGDTITNVSEDHKLNPQEFLVANPKYRSEDSLLTIGDEVSIALINPQISLVAEMYEIEDVEQYFEKQTVYDSKKPYGYSQVTQQGINGITRFTETYKSVNGEAGQATVLNKEVIREKVNQITTKGKKVNYGPIPSQYVDSGGTWAWPTNSGYKITSNYAWRWGKLHAALDIAWLPRRSPAYAAGDGVVVTASRGSGSGWSLGNYVVIKHNNNIYTQYAHLDVISVKEGQTVRKGQVVGGIGDTGRATGVHLHFAAFYGMPYQGGTPFNPMKLYR